jgi:outer membrane lipoprotein-sorting protein
LNTLLPYLTVLNYKLTCSLFFCWCLLANQAWAGSDREITPSFAGHASDIDTMVTGKKTRDGKNYLDQMLDSASHYSEYTYKCDQTTRKEEKSVSGTAKFYFKRNNRMRLDVTSGGGVKKGSVVVRRKDGKIRAHGGSTLRFLKMTLEPDSRLLMLPNGFNVGRSDFHSLISDLKRKVSNGSKTEITAQPVWDRGHTGRFHVLEVSNSDSSPESLIYRVLIDPNTKLPVEWNCYKKGFLYSITRFKEFHPNPGLKDDVFEM